MSDDNIVQFPGNSKTPEEPEKKENDQLFQWGDISVTINWDDIAADLADLDLNLNTWYTDDAIVKDTQFNNLAAKLNELYDLVEDNPELIQFVEKYISTYTENLKRKL